MTPVHFVGGRFSKHVNSNKFEEVVAGQEFDYEEGALHPVKTSLGLGVALLRLRPKLINIANLV